MIFSPFLSSFHLLKWVILKTENSFLFLRKLIYFDVKRKRTSSCLILSFTLFLFFLYWINSSISTFFFSVFSSRMIQQNENYYICEALDDKKKSVYWQGHKLLEPVPNENYSYIFQVTLIASREIPWIIFPVPKPVKCKIENWILKNKQ